MKDQIEKIILKAVPNAKVYVMDPDGEHFQAIVISETFVGMSLVKQHKLIMNALKEAFETTMHALQLKTFTPEKWDKVKDQYL